MAAPSSSSAAAAAAVVEARLGPVYARLPPLRAAHRGRPRRLTPEEQVPPTAPINPPPARTAFRNGPRSSRMNFRLPTP